MKVRPFTNREGRTFMADGIESSAREALRDGFPECAARLFAWAEKVRASADEPEEDEPAPVQGDLFTASSALAVEETR